MRSGGEIKLDTTRLQDTDNSGRAGDSEADVHAALVNSSTPTAPVISNAGTEIIFGTDKYRWQELQQAVQNVVQSGANLTPEEVKRQVTRDNITGLSNTAADLQTRKEALDRELPRGARTQQNIDQDKRQIERELAQARSNLQGAIQRARQAGVSQNDAVVQRAIALAGSDGTNGSSGGGTFTSTSQGLDGGRGAMGMGLAQNAGANGGAQNANGQRPAMGAGIGGGSALGINNAFGGLQPPSSAAYARALDLDSFISDGIDGLGKSRREGQKLMMLFFYFARMAESGDLGAMYQFIKFINYIIAKDKAKQNVQISTKLIQLQDMSRKATDALMQTPSDGKDNKELNEFTKALHKAKSDEAVIATSQKLLADMLQEFAHVVEAMVNSTKNMLDAWGRVLRTASSR